MTRSLKGDYWPCQFILDIDPTPIERKWTAGEQAAQLRHGAYLGAASAAGLVVMADPDLPPEMPLPDYLKPEPGR